MFQPRNTHGRGKGGVGEGEEGRPGRRAPPNLGAATAACWRGKNSSFVNNLTLIAAYCRLTSIIRATDSRNSSPHTTHAHYLQRAYLLELQTRWASWVRCKVRQRCAELRERQRADVVAALPQI